MSRARIVVVIVAIALLAFLAWRWLGPGPRERTLSGYIEGESLFLAAPVSGTVRSIAAAEGQRVAAGARLFAIDPATLSAETEQAVAQVTEARTQIAAAQANAQQAAAEAAAAAADADRARRDLNRLLAVRGDDPAAVAGKDIDAARAELNEANARLKAARDTARAAPTWAQESQARGGQREVAIRVDQLSPPAPSAARVEEVFYRPGEWVAANQPVVSLLPDNRVKVRFFVPEAEVARYRPGETVRFACDSCPNGLTARIAYVSPRPEFTPPIIFSRDSRDRLVFMVEAIPTQAAKLMPGLPVDVEPLPGD